MADISHNVETCPGKSQYEEEAERQVVKNTLADIAVTRNGVTLHPQPTSDPLDPLNWSNLRKHSILAIVMWKYFLFAYLTTTTIPSFTQIEKRLGINYAQTSWTISLPSLGLAIGPPLWSSLADIYGRRIVFIAGSVIALVSTIGIAVTTNFKGYMTGRFFQGVGVSPSAAIGMAIVGDLFFEYERGQKLGLWVMAMDCGFLLGPLIGGFMNLVSLDWVIWLNVILFGVLLVLVVFFLPETLYPRTTMLHQMPAIQSGAKEGSDLELAAVKVRSADQSDLPRTTKLPFINFKPVPGMRHPKPWDSILLTWSTFRIFAVTIPLWGFALTIYWWNPAAMTMIPAAYAQFPPQIQGLLFVGMLLGIVFAEIFCSGNLSDYICAKLTIKNDHIRIAEMRLWLIYPACVLISVGLVLWGISIDQNYHWMVGQVAFFLFSVGFQTSNTVVATYLVDSYPLQSISIITYYSVIINLAGFSSPFFISEWVESTGWTWTYGTQCMLVFFVGMPVFALIHRYGPWLRAKSLQPSWVNGEFDTAI